MPAAHRRIGQAAAGCGWLVRLVVVCGEWPGILTNPSLRDRQGI